MSGVAEWVGTLSSSRPVAGGALPESDVMTRVVRAGSWSLALRGATRGLGLARNIVLARLLAPSDMGLFGTALVVLSFLERFSNTGIQAALVQMKDDPRPYLNTAWTVSLLRGFALAGALVAGGGEIARFLGAPEAGALVRLLGLSILMRGMENTGVIMLQRDLEARKQFLYRFGGLIVDLGVSVVLALILKSAWALVWGLLAGNVVTLIVSYLVHPYRPTLRLDRSQVRQLGRYGRWVFLANILFFLAYRGDNAVVAKFFGPEALGLYVLAYVLAEAATVEISLVLGSVTFPLYARLQHERGRLVAAHTVVSDLVASVALPAAVLLSLLAQPVVGVILGPRWVGAAALLPPLAVAGGLRAIVTNGRAVCSGVGRPERAFLVTLVGVGVTYAVMLPLIRLFDLRGVGLAVLSGSASMVVVYARQVKRTLGIPTAELIRAVVPGIVLAGAVALPVLVVRHVAVGPAASLALVGVLGSGAYVAASVLLWRGLGAGPLRLLSLVRHGFTGLRRAV